MVTGIDSFKEWFKHDCSGYGPDLIGESLLNK